MPILSLPKVGPDDRLYKRVSWADPGLMLATSDFEYFDINVGVTTSMLVAQPDPKRWTVSFACPGVAIGSFVISPFTPIEIGAKGVSPNFDDNWYTIFTHGSMVQGGWYVLSTGVSVLRVMYNKISV